MVLYKLSLAEINELVVKYNIKVKDVNLNKRYGYWTIIFEDPATKPLKCIDSSFDNFEHTLLWHIETFRLIDLIKGAKNGYAKKNIKLRKP